jgi:hypothetical protein
MGLFAETAMQKANQHEREFIDKLDDKPQYGCDQKGRQFKDDKKNLGSCPSVFDGG